MVFALIATLWLVGIRLSYSIGIGFAIAVTFPALWDSESGATCWTRRSTSVSVPRSAGCGRTRYRSGCNTEGQRPPARNTVSCRWPSEDRRVRICLLLPVGSRSRAVPSERMAAILAGRNQFDLRKCESGRQCIFAEYCAFVVWLERPSHGDGNRTHHDRTSLRAAGSFLACGVGDGRDIPDRVDVFATHSGPARRLGRYHMPTSCRPTRRTCSWNHPSDASPWPVGARERADCHGSRRRHMRDDGREHPDVVVVELSTGHWETSNQKPSRGRT